MQFWLLLSLCAGISWGWGTFTAVKKIGNTWLGLVLGLIVGIGCFWVLKTFGTRAIHRLKLNKPKLPLCRLLLAWFMCGAALLFTFIAPWCIDWLLKVLV